MEFALQHPFLFTLICLAVCVTVGVIGISVGDGIGRRR